MIGLDTNVLIRYIVQDDEYQARIATDFIENECSKENPAFINEVTMCEIVWVLKRAYRYDKSIILILSNKYCQMTKFKLLLIDKQRLPLMITKLVMLIFLIISLHN